MITVDLAAKLSLLDYSRDWIETGILTEAVLNTQIQEFETGEDTNKEHYRYRTLTTYLKTHNTLSDTQVEQIIELLRNDQDEAMASSVLTGILKMQNLTDKQFEIVQAALSTFGSWTEKHIEKQQAIRKKANAND